MQLSEEISATVTTKQNKEASVAGTPGRTFRVQQPCGTLQVRGDEMELGTALKSIVLKD
jgi:hypothetical protein